MKTLLKLLNVENETEAVAAVGAFNEFLTDVRSATGADTMTNALKSVRSNASLLRQVEATTGKTGAEALGVIVAWKQAADGAGSTAAELANLKQSQADAAAKAKLDEAVAGGKLTPANRAQLEELYTGHGEAALDAALAVLRPIAASGSTAAPLGSAPPSAPATSGVIDKATSEVLEQMNVTPEQYKAWEADARKDNPHMYR